MSQEISLDQPLIPQLEPFWENKNLLGNTQSTDDLIHDVVGKILPKEKSSIRELTSLDPAREVLDVGLDFEKNCSLKLEEMEGETKKVSEMIDSLLDLSKELGEVGTPNTTDVELNGKIKTILKDLESKGLKLLDIPENGKISKESFITLKARVGSIIDKLRTQVQNTFSKMQTIIQQVSSVNDTMKKMIMEVSDLVKKILERSIKR